MYSCRQESSWTWQAPKARCEHDGGFALAGWRLVWEAMPLKGTDVVQTVYPPRQQESNVG